MGVYNKTWLCSNKTYLKNRQVARFGPGCLICRPLLWTDNFLMDIICTY